MNANYPVLVKLTIDEKRYAKVLSLRLPGCIRSKEGSISHSLRYLLRKYAKEQEGILLNKD